MNQPEPSSLPNREQLATHLDQLLAYLSHRVAASDKNANRNLRKVASIRDQEENPELARRAQDLRRTIEKWVRARERWQRWADTVKALRMEARV